MPFELREKNLPHGTVPLVVSQTSRHQGSHWTKIPAEGKSAIQAASSTLENMLKKLRICQEFTFHYCGSVFQVNTLKSIKLGKPSLSTTDDFRFHKRPSGPLPLREATVYQSHDTPKAALQPPPPPPPPTATVLKTLARPLPSRVLHATRAATPRDTPPCWICHDQDHPTLGPLPPWPLHSRGHSPRCSLPTSQSLSVVTPTTAGHASWPVPFSQVPH